MAVYDYQCANCGSTFEVERPMGFSGRVKCANCSSTRTSRVFAPAGVVFKGSGFYVTDSAGKSSAASVNGNGAKPEPAPEKSKSAPAAD